MTSVERKQRFLRLFLVFSLVICIVLPIMQPIVASAAESAPNFASTNVMDDLKSSAINGKPFDIANYPYNENLDIQVIQVVEYCYSYKANLRDNYGLYVYVYNPKGLNLTDSDKMNKIQIATAYDENGKPSDYMKFPLQLCSKVEDGDYKNLFYKFKVIDRNIGGMTLAERVNSAARRYDVSGIELASYKANNAIDYPVNAAYIFTGYAKGYGPDPAAESTLNCRVEYLETVSLDVKHTFYRTMTSSLGKDHQNQLNSVYFAVPTRLFEDYGGLQRIKAEWYEYKTSDIIVTSNEDFRNAAFSYLGNPESYLPDLRYGLAVDPVFGAMGVSGVNTATWTWNAGERFVLVTERCDLLTYLFYTENIGTYDPAAEPTEIGGVSSNELYEWILTYDKSFHKGTLPIKNGTISADLFADDIDESRKMNNEHGVIQQGYSYYDFDASLDTQNMLSWSSTDPNFWDNCANFGLWQAIVGVPSEESLSVTPIYIVKESDLLGDNNTIASRLLVSVSDVESIKNAFYEAKTVSGKDDEEKELVLFRFATSDYYSADAQILDKDGGLFNGDKYLEGEAYLARESVFLDFDVIQLTFNRDGEYTVIPVVSSPIDIVSAITPPLIIDDGMDYLKVIALIILVIILAIIFAPLLPIIIRGIVWLVMLPVKAIAALFKRRKKDDTDL